MLNGLFDCLWKFHGYTIGTEHHILDFLMSDGFLASSWVPWVNLPLVPMVCKSLLADLGLNGRICVFPSLSENDDWTKESPPLWGSPLPAGGVDCAGEKPAVENGWIEGRKLYRDPDTRVLVCSWASLILRLHTNKNVRRHTCWNWKL